MPSSKCLRNETRRHPVALRSSGLRRAASLISCSISFSTTIKEDNVDEFSLCHLLLIYTSTKTKTKRTKPQWGRAPKLVCSKSVVATAAKAPAMAPIAPSLIPNASMMTAATTMMPVMMLPPAREFDMKMLEELNASISGSPCYSFILGEKRDHMIDIVRNVVTIHSSCEANKLATLTPKRWVNFILYCKQIDNEAKEVNLKTRPVGFRLHLGDGWYVSVTSGYNCVDFHRFYVPYGTSHEHVHPTRDGISLRLDEWQNSWCLYRLFTNVIQNWLQSVPGQNRSCMDSADLA